MFWWGYLAGAGTAVLIWAGLFVWMQCEMAKAIAGKVGSP